MEAVDEDKAVKLTTDEGSSVRIAVVFRALPTGGGAAVLYRCPGCGEARRYLYTHALVFGRLVSGRDWQCEACAGLRWGLQGRYRSAFERGIFAVIEKEYGAPRYHEPLPRHPWDPRAVSNPRMIAEEFRDQLIEARAAERSSRVGQHAAASRSGQPGRRG